jgi:hypothetical protein
MSSYRSNRNAWLARLAALSALGALLVASTNGCDDTGGKEGDRCNPLVLHDECNDGLHCTQATCSEAYCCPTGRSSSDPHCNNQAGCPDTDGGDEAGADSASPAEAGVDAHSDGANGASDALLTEGG